jgi:hypothetical protein
MQREQKRGRLTMDGRRTDDGSRCTLLVVCEVGGAWVLYPHGAAQLGVRLGQPDAETLARAIQAGDAR